LLDVEPAQALMVAAHRWDLDGAAAAGLRTAFVERPGEKGPNRAADRAADVTADLKVTSFNELADALA
jgi:2-haloacid dehalogenase